MNSCYHCKKEVTVERKITRTDTCPHCNSNLRCCMNCSLYDAAVYNACRESQADRCVEKDRANFCVYFNFSESGSKVSERPVPANRRENPLNALFKKK